MPDLGFEIGVPSAGEILVYRTCAVEFLHDPRNFPHCQRPAGTGVPVSGHSEGGCCFAAITADLATSVSRESEFTDATESFPYRRAVAPRR
jgi:hypothetical protein